jgi:hypothetical protein
MFRQVYSHMWCICVLLIWIIFKGCKFIMEQSIHLLFIAKCHLKFLDLYFFLAAILLTLFFLKSRCCQLIFQNGFFKINSEKYKFSSDRLLTGFHFWKMLKACYSPPKALRSAGFSIRPPNSIHSSLSLDSSPDSSEISCGFFATHSIWILYLNFNWHEQFTLGLWIRFLMLRGNASNRFRLLAFHLSYYISKSYLWLDEGITVLDA